MAKRKLPPGTWIEREMFESPAYHALKGWAPQMLTILLGKRIIKQTGRTGKERRICINSDSLNLTYIEAKKKYGVTKQRLTRAVDDLLAKGFVSIIHQGGCYKKDKTIFGLSEKWRIWRPSVVFESRKKDPIARGFRRPNIISTHENGPIHSHENGPIRRALG